MIDDPLALIVQGIFVLAAGMYPVGFLFGVCSDCCQGCNCNKCNHYYNGTGCRSVESYSVTIDGYGTLTSGFINNFDSGDCLDGSEPQLVLENNLQLACNGGTEVSVTARIRFDVPFIEDECFCARRLFDPSVQFLFSEGLDNIAFFTNISGNGFLECGGGTFGLAFSDLALDGPSNDCYDELLEWIADLVVTGSYTVAECDCGACCDEGCEDDVAEGGCANWAGVGTACDDDPSPCEE